MGYFIVCILLTACTLPFASRAYVAVEMPTSKIEISGPTDIPTLVQVSWTPSWTVTNSLTPTGISSKASSVSPSPTNTLSPSPTITDAPPLTYTDSPTESRTLTSTRTFTRTPTSTPSRMLTPSPTPSQTMAVSPGIPSFTFTASVTRTPSRTATSTMTRTVTAPPMTLPPPTLTYTRTFTIVPPTATFTRTSTSSPQPTTPPPPTLTFTSTFTGLPPSATFTRTFTPVPPTVTFILTPTSTATVTVILPSAPPSSPTLTRSPTSPPPTATTFSCNPATNSGFESQVIALINNERVNAIPPVDPLSAQSQLGSAARGHSQDMACNGFFSHTGSDGSSPSARISRQGYSWGAVAENIAAGYGDPASVVSGWMGSQGHKANILNGDYTEIGIGYIYVAGSPYGAYWTANFASPKK